jgi:glycosyltransferase involved in cell wall biosynthesis
MKFLFIHQNFPGQFKHLAPALAKAGHQVRALTINPSTLEGVAVHCYQPKRSSSQQIHPWVVEFETKIIRGEACAIAAMQLKAAGFKPDRIIMNPGWGEGLFLKDVWPDVRMLGLFEFYYAANGQDVNFDLEFSRSDVGDNAKVRCKNAHILMALQDLDGGWSPTYYQHSTFPSTYHERIKVAHDGIDTRHVMPNKAATLTWNNRVFSAGQEIITFVNRNLEPLRGYHVFMRALPEVLRCRPNAVALIIGGDGISYGEPAPVGKSWKHIFLDEVKSKLDLNRVIFMDKVPYEDYLKVLQISACHVYLTYPFVLGWSCVEAMSAGCLVVGSATPPVQEVIEHGRNGLLVDFFDIPALSRTIVDCLAKPGQYVQLRMVARQGAIDQYDLNSVCLPKLLQLVLN